MTKTQDFLKALEHSPIRRTPEARLIMAVIKQAIDDGDVRFLNGENLEFYINLIKGEKNT